jgi:hypothetical protein
MGRKCFLMELCHFFCQRSSSFSRSTKKKNLRKTKFLFLFSPSSGNMLVFFKSEENVSLLEIELFYFSSCILVTLKISAVSRPKRTKNWASASWPRILLYNLCTNLSLYLVEFEHNFVKFVSC